MIWNHLKTTLRNLAKQRGYAVINIVGLAVGITCCLLIALYVRDELSFDRFHEQGDRIYRVVFDYSAGGSGGRSASTQGVLAPTLGREVPDLLHAVRIQPTAAVLRSGNRQFNESGLFYADSAFFEVFTFPFVRGDPSTALQAPFSIVLSETLARKYFGEDDPLGRTLTAENRDDMVVTGVFRDAPRTSHLAFDALISMSTIEKGGPWWLFENWASMNFQTYALLAEASVPAQVEQRMNEAMGRHAAERFAGLEWNDAALHLEPLYDVYLRSDRGGAGPRGSLANLYAFSAVAVFILLIACVNFMNLATARSTERAHEVGVRKAVGAGRGSLIGQFLTEAILLTLLSTLLALLLAELALPLFRELSGKPLSGAVLLQPAVVLSLGGAALVLGLLAGSYPAFALSSFQPVRVLKGKSLGTPRGGSLRKALVVFQFGTSIALVIGTLVVHAQLGFMQGQRLGFRPDNRLLINFGGDASVLARLDAVKQELSAQPGVLGVATSSTVPGQGVPGGGGELEDEKGIERSIGAKVYMVDHAFLDVYGIEVVAGRGFSLDFPEDAATAALLNETAVRQYGFSSNEAALGRHGSFWEREMNIIGVVRDFHHYALHRPVEPMVMRIDTSYFDTFSLRLAPGDVRATLAALESAWTTLVPHRPFEAGFLDQTYDAQYRAEVRFREVFGVFAALAIFIACLGLFGLASFTIQQRTKEIGVRKVLGASVPEIVVLLTRDFTRPVAVAFVLAAPVAYLAMDRWLAGFAYRIQPGAAAFLLAGALALGIACLTVGYQSVKAARANPVDSLRYE